MTTGDGGLDARHHAAAYSHPSLTLPHLVAHCLSRLMVLQALKLNDFYP